MTKRKKTIVGLTILLGVALGGGIAYWRTRPTTFSVAVIGFFDSDNLVWLESGGKSGIKVETFPRSAITAKRLARYDAVVLRTIGWRPKTVETDALDSYAKMGVIVPYPPNGDLFSRYASMTESLAPKINGYLSSPTPRNTAAFLTLLQATVLKRPIDVPPPEKLPAFGYFYHGAEISPTLDAFFKRNDLPILPVDAPRVALVGMFLNPIKTADFSPVETLIDRLAAKGIRVIPLFGFKNNPALLEECRPDLVIDFPLGRILKEGEAPEIFERLRTPVLTAISLSCPEKTWRTEPVGMTTSYQNLAVALPELDGATEPTPISTLEPDADGFTFRTPLDERIDRLVTRVQRWLILQKKPNAEKKIAIFYYRHPGAAAITAQSLDVVPSLYRTLTAMRNAGYDLGDAFPASEEEFDALIEKKGRVIGQWAPGAFEKFLTEGNPERVATDVYRDWLGRDLSADSRRELQSVWGTAPGQYFTGQTDAGSFLAVSRVAFGNVVLLPQPTTAIISDDREGDDFASVHGTNKAPPHFYLAAYLWVREAFHADALVHFGTHGSLEFTRGKSLLLTENDWPDALVGDIPHVYLYSINNVGEALLAKRRTRAVLVSHKTPPFVEAGLTDSLAALDDLLERYEASEEEAIRRELFREIQAQAKQNDFLTEEEEKQEEKTVVESLRRRLCQIRERPVTDGLHVIGRPWTSEQIERTAAAIGTESAADALRESDRLETERFLDALAGRFVSPSTGGDPLVNPDSIPTGRNIAGINIERTPDDATFRVARRLTDETLAEFRASHDGAWPRRVALTLWGGEYLRTGGLTVAQGLILLGARPVFDSKGIIRDVEIVPSEELGRPRIDLVVQTSGQFRDAAPSRIELLDSAVRKIAALGDGPFPNFVREHTESTAEALRQKGYTKDEAAELATARVFGSTGALDYGTGIRRLVERSDRWESKAEIADQYLLNMGGIYRGGQVWGVPIAGLLEANLAETDLLLQSRSSNTWGPVKLDHLYEFGTLALAVREKTGVEPIFTLTDARLPKKVRNVSLADSIGEELRTTLWNRRWLEGILREGKSGSNVFPEMTQNLFGWSAVGSEGLIDERCWQTTYETLVADRLGLGMRDYFDRTNPAALAETTGLLLDAARKNFWSPSEEVRKNLAAVHADVLKKNGPSCSYEVCGNPKLREFIGSLLSETEAVDYQAALDTATRPAEASVEVQGIELTETTPKADKADKADKSASAESGELASDQEDAFRSLDRRWPLVAAALVIAGFLFGGTAGRRERRYSDSA